MAFFSPINVPHSVGGTIYLDDRNMLFESVAGGENTLALMWASIAIFAPALRVPALRDIVGLLIALLPQSAKDFLDQMGQPVALQADTHSRGWVKATSTDVSVLPEVDPQTFSDPRDLPSHIARFEELLRVVKSDSMKPFLVEKPEVPQVFVDILERVAPELMNVLGCLLAPSVSDKYPFVLLPCAPTDPSPEALEKYLRDALVSSYHYFGTAASGSVVDPKDFHVLGTQNLYVADASVIPKPTTVNPQGTIMALGHYIGSILAEKAVQALVI